MESKILTLADAFIAEGINPDTRPDVSMLPEIDQEPTIKKFIAEVLIRALNNEGQEKPWVADFSDDSQTKYEHIYHFSPASGWSLFGVFYWSSVTYCGSRRVFRTRAIANDAWNRFKEHFIAIL
ncbi:hypothetical protein [Flavobacterium sp. N1994]|uniref:hypothetical protein n=1 Tax=Flavobacterium sp. N1994 TaxID=2986827 RepID=UPI002222E609|nr:hypothetical protein [Flavobacterium sp. N1994]